MQESEIKNQYPYITEEQLEKIRLGEAFYTDFLTEEDLQKIKDKNLAEKRAEREAQIQQIIAGLKQAEQSEEAQLIVGGTFALQDYFFSKRGRYIGQDIMHTFIQYPEMRGLRVYVMAYEVPEFEHNPAQFGFNIRFVYTHESGLKFSKKVPGKGPKPESEEWELITE